MKSFEAVNTGCTLTESYYQMIHLGAKERQHFFYDADKWNNCCRLLTWLITLTYVTLFIVYTDIDI